MKRIKVVSVFRWILPFDQQIRRLLDNRVRNRGVIIPFFLLKFESYLESELELLLGDPDPGIEITQIQILDIGIGSNLLLKSEFTV